MFLIVLVIIINILDRGGGAAGHRKVEPRVAEPSSSCTLKSIINVNHTDCFAVNELMLNGEKALKGNGDFFVAIVYYGEGSVICGND